MFRRHSLQIATVSNVLAAAAWAEGSFLSAQTREVTEVKAKPGENVTLHCNCPTDAAITLVQCKISGLEDNVFYFRDNKLMESFENPQFHGRVELKDPEMKNGDCSVVLKNVSAIDKGTYTCLVLTERNEKFVASVHLSVSEGSGNETNDGNLKNGQINDGNLKNGQINDENEWGYLELICLCVVVLVVLLLVLVTVRDVVKYQRAKMRRSEECVDEVEMRKLNV